MRLEMLTTAVLLSVLSGCRADRSEVNGTTLRDTHEDLHAVLWMQTSAEYQMACRTAYRTAAAALEAALDDPKWTAALEQTTLHDGMPPAIIVDVDETVLDNSAFEGRMVRDRSRFSPTLWEQWVATKSATAVPGALEFLRGAADRGVTVFYVTNRSAASEPATRANLESLGFPLSNATDVVLTEGENGWTSDKTARRTEIASRYRVLLIIGDDLADFMPGAKAPPEDRRRAASKYDDRFGRSWILLPNPVYGSWERALYPPNSTDEETLRRKFGQLRAF